VFGSGEPAGGASAGSGATSGGAHGGDTAESNPTGGRATQGGAEAASGASAAGDRGAGGSDHAPSGGSSAGTGVSPALDIDRGLVAYFPFDEADGAAVINVEDTSRSGSCVGSCLHPTGLIGRALRLRNAEANVDWVELPPGLLSDLSALTITLWVRVLANDRQDAPAFHFSRGELEAFYFTPDDLNPSTSHSGAAFGVKYDGELQVSIRGTDSLADEAWHHIAVTWDAAAFTALVDGKQLGAKLNPSVLPVAFGATTLNYLGRALSDQITAFNGDFDELRIYGRVLEQRELEAVFTAR
jgi:hypothetical protein